MEENQWGGARPKVREDDARGGARPKVRDDDKRGRPPLLQPTEGTTSVMLRSPLPCSIRNFDNPDGICGRPATVAYAWQQEPGGEWATPGLWVVQPVCRQCAESAVKVYEE